MFGGVQETEEVNSDDDVVMDLMISIMLMMIIMVMVMLMTLMIKTIITEQEGKLHNDALRLNENYGKRNNLTVVYYKSNKLLLLHG